MAKWRRCWWLKTGVLFGRDQGGNRKVGLTKGMNRTLADESNRVRNAELK
jgi:hypothetical protein